MRSDDFLGRGRGSVKGKRETVLRDEFGGRRLSKFGLESRGEIAECIPREEI